MMITPSVLVVEDHADTRHMVEEYLQLHGFATVGAVNGADALGKLHEHPPALILLDLTMPVMDGWQFRREQQRLTDALARIPVVVLSALHDCARHAQTLGAIEFLPKPIDLDRLAAVVARLCATTAV
jgi:CheY-like chemotaxis protein